MANSEESNIFEQGSPLKTYLTVAMPVVLSMAISVVYNIADTYFIAQTQNTQLVAGVSLCAPVFTILMAFGNIFGQGGSSLLSRLFGQQKLNETKAVSSFCFYIALATGLILGVVMLLFQTPLLYALGSDAETLEYARQYFVVLAFGSPFIAVSFIHMNLLRSEGMSKESMFGSVSGLLLNVILDPIFISGFGWGSFGAALASVLGYVLSDFFYLVIVLKKSRILSVNPSILKIPGGYVGQIFGVGISAAVTNWMSSICLIITNHFLLPYGNDQIAAMGIVQKVSMIILMILIGMSFGSAPIVGYYYGGKQYKRLKELLRMVIGLTCGVAILMGIVLFAAAGPCIRIFLKDSNVVSAGILMLRLQIPTMFLGAFITIITVCFQASGKGFEALITSISRQGVVFLLVIFLANAAFGYIGILASQMISDIISALLIGILYYRSFYSKLN